MDRIRLESESVLIILNNVYLKKIKLIGSDILLHEIDKILDPIRKSNLLALTNNISAIIHLNDKIYKRAKEIQSLGIIGFDAFHIACAEKGNINIFLTTDDKLSKLSKKYSNEINVAVNNPLSWIKEYLIK